MGSLVGAVRVVRVLAAVVIGGSIAMAAFVAGRLSIGQDRVRQAEPACEAVAHPDGDDAKRVVRLMRALPASSLRSANDRAEDDAAAAADARFARAEYLFAQVFKQLDDQARSGVTVAEGRAGAVLPYLSGMLQGAIQADPGMRSAFARQFTTALCDRELADDQAISVGQMALILPDVTTAQGIQCFFSKAKEGVPFWTMLDAWRRSGLEKTPLLEQIRASATDPRTTRRFLSNEEAMAQRISKDVLNSSSTQERTASK